MRADQALCGSPTRAAPCARFVAANSPGNLPIHSVDPNLSTSATRQPLLPAGDLSARHGPGCRRAGWFVQLWIEHRWLRDWGEPEPESWWRWGLPGPGGLTETRGQAGTVTVNSTEYPATGQRDEWPGTGTLAGPFWWLKTSALAVMQLASARAAIWKNDTLP